jgi:hypothetical protein
MTELRTWKALIPKAADWLTSNNSHSVSLAARYAHSEKVRAWRRATVEALQRKRFPTAVSPVTIHLKFFYAGHRPVRDRLNLEPTVKAIVDGVGPSRRITRDGQTWDTWGYGFLPDDDDKHLLATTWELLPASGNAVGLHITATPDTVERLQLLDIPTGRKGRT